MSLVFLHWRSVLWGIKTPCGICSEGLLSVITVNSCCIRQVFLKGLSGILAKSGLLRYSIWRPKIVFLYFLFVKRVWYTCIKNNFIYFPIPYFCFARQVKHQFGHNWVSGGDRKLKFMDFERRYGQINAGYEILLWLSIYGRPIKFTDKIWKKLINFWERQVELTTTYSQAYNQILKIAQKHSTISYRLRPKLD